MKKRNIVLADCQKHEISDFMDALNDEKLSFEIHSHVSNWKRTSIFSELKRYLKYFAVAFWYFLNRRNYDVILGWQQFYTLIFCFYCNLFSVKKKLKVIALNFTYKEKNGRLCQIYRWFMGKCLSEKYLDYIHVPSNQYADIISKEFSYPRERIIVTSFGVKDHFSEFSSLDAPEGYMKDGYALAIGRSNRDYDFLIRSWENIDYPLVIISDKYKKTSENRNISIYTNIAGEESNKWISNCGLMIVPIDDGTICSGDTVLLTAMSMKRKIIVTTPSTLAEMYVTDGVNAVLAEKNEKVFGEKVKRVLFSNDYADIGENARASYLDLYTISAMGKAVRNAILDD